MTVTWTSGYDISEAYPFVEWGMKSSPATRTAAGTVTFDGESLCGMVIIISVILGTYCRILETSFSEGICKLI